jgi:hypothetical protein
MCARQAADDPENFLAGQDDRQAFGPFTTVAVQVARTESMGKSRSFLSTSRYKKSRALRAWFWVEAATFWSKARW